VDEALPHGDVGDISGPNLIGPVDHHIPKELRIDLVRRVGILGLGKVIGRLKAKADCSFVYLFSFIGKIILYDDSYSAKPQTYFWTQIPGEGQDLLHNHLFLRAG